MAHILASNATFGMVNKARTHCFPCSHLAGKLRAAAMVSFCELNRASSHVVGTEVPGNFVVGSNS